MLGRLLAVVFSLIFPVTAAVPAHAATTALPSKAVWTQDVNRAMAGSQSYLRQRVAARAPGERLAIVLDIDNTSLATRYAWPQPVAPTLALARLAVSKNVTVWFVTGRKVGELMYVKKVLTRVGYRYAGVCGRRSGERVEIGKQRCRRAITAQGYRITANVGNRDTDFIGGDYEKRFQLPDYDLALS